MKLFQNRNNLINIIILALMAVLLVRLFMLTVIQGERWDSAAESVSTKTVYTSAPRGEILDRYGRVIAGNKSSFDVQFSELDLEPKELNSQALLLARTLKANGDQLTDDFPILMKGNGSFTFSYDEAIETWLTEQGMPTYYTAKQAFDRLREEYGVDAGMDVYDAQTELQTTHNVYPPMSVKTMKFSEQQDKERFLERYKMDKDLTAEKAFRELRKHFEIEESMSDAEAREVMIVRDVLAAQGYYSYMPASVASDISTASIISLAEQGGQLSAVDVVAESTRSYPYGKTAAHILGYLGKISESEKEEYLEKGYSVTDIIGKQGLEKTMESTLKGADGQKVMEVNAYGEMVRVLDETEPEAGKDVYLTIDLDLQKTTEDALDQALQKIQTGGTFTSQYGNYGFGKAYRNANVGAAVAIEVDTGDVLALANSPSYDPNLFVTGISTEDWNSLQAENPRDPLSPQPLYNVATMTAVQPGSTFKMVTSTAALDNGLDPERKLRDAGAVQLGNRTYGCLSWNRYKSTHGYINLYEALEVSCNYYFYDLAANRDWATGKSLGLSDEMGVETLTKYAEMYGLGQSSGIEIAETVAPVPSAEKKMESMKNYLKNVLIGRAERYFTEEVVSDKKQLDAYIEEIVSWTEENPTRGELLERMPTVGIREDMVETVTDLCKFSYFNQANWTTGDELNIAIGQGENAYTPLQIANYVATIGNGGVRNEVSLIRAVEDQGLNLKAEGVPLAVKDASILDDIIEGMHRVAQGSKGSGKSLFGNFPVQVAAKTGTAERAGKINPPDEIEYLKQHLSGFNRSLSWSQVETEAKRLMKEYSNTFTSESSACRQAIINLSDGRVSSTTLDQYKASYDNFAWFVAMAPADDPQIAVAVLIFQGGSGPYAGTVAREVIGKYLELNKQYTDYSMETVVTP